MNEPLDGEVQRIRTELTQYAELGVIEYYLPTDPEGERYVVGTQGRILNMDPEQAMCFLAGAAAVTFRLAANAGWRGTLAETTNP
jgi:hypothetical protein